MSDTGELRRGVTSDAVVRPLALAAERPCSRPSCSAPAAATLTFNYREREAWISRLADTRAPQSYDLCGAHAARTQPPHGWRMRDRRPAGRQAAADAVSPPTSYDGPDTVAVLAAALRAVPDLPTPDPSALAVGPAPSGTAASEPAAPGPAAQPRASSAGTAADEAAVATLEDGTTSPVLEASATATDGEAAVAPPPQPPAPRPVLAERNRTEPARGVASDW